MCVTYLCEFKVSGKKPGLCNSNCTHTTSHTNQHIVTLCELTWETDYSESPHIQGGSNMIGTNCDLFTHK
jgi:hypothetical protein